MPAVPDAWLELLSTPFPCLIGLAPAQTRHLPRRLSSRMALLDLDKGQLSAPHEALPPLPAREAAPLHALFGRLREQARRAARAEGGAELSVLEQMQAAAEKALRQASGGSSADGAGGDGAPSEDGAAEAADGVDGAARRGGLDFFASLLRDVSHYFPETAGVAAEAAGEGDVDAQTRAFVAAQRATA